MADNPMQETAIKRLQACRTLKSNIELDFKECYFFLSPWRQRQLNSTSAPAQQRLLDASDLNTDLGFLIGGDFVTQIVNTFLPEAQIWCERGRGMFIRDDIWDQVKDQVKADDKIIFDAIKASNFYAELPKAFYPDLAIGTCALWIEQPHPARAITVSTVALRELEINLGPFGEIDDRFAVRYPRNLYIEAMLGEEIWQKVSDKKKTTTTDKPTDRTQVAWGFWRKWDRNDDEVWQHVILVDNELVHETEITGEGSCPLIPMRFNPTADWPHGQGPMMQYLPTFRQIDEMEIMRSENAELSIRPPLGIEDESFTNFEQGLESGMLYPMAMRSQNPIVPLYEAKPPQAENYQYDEKIKHLRKGFYVDYPEQSGDTPPTLGQWLDELARAQRRIGTPGMSFWREGPMQIFLRYKYLLERAGAVKPIMVDGRNVSVRPYNPTQRAAEQQEIATAMQALELAAKTFPEEFRMVVDGKATMKGLFEKMRVTGLIKIRADDDVKKMVGMMAQLAAQRQQVGGAAPPAAAGAPAAV